MKIWTLWHKGDDEDAPWFVDGIDEYTLDNNSEFPPDYLKHRESPLVREMIIDVPEASVRALFNAPNVKATVVSDRKEGP